ncbi:RNA 2',3'-cyclic phosphodiesterase [Neiella marina]|uniref:RNA 2',3'-cyclic phosphodiesterase n=1 Tax=Neiella holothuriorum TaxID=2870530 RepID=A0ABS7ECR2_9GAMM|nr:RNA 2',3'-cyclic phosphodiesterase [Neiella holothuriorum]MBW8189517.1 RNA 2',3'-cyclic phosphodiesterase [Neiella holothuriorum]
MAERLFVALPLPPTIRRQVARWQRAYQPLHAKPVPADNLHLTLAFLGSCDARVKQQVCEQLSSIALPSWCQELSQTGWFAKPKIGYLAPQQTAAALQTLASQVQQRMQQLGMVLPEHDFIPHVSVFRHFQHGHSWRASHSGTQPHVNAMSWPVTEFCLYQSCNDRYKVLHRWPLTESSTNRP